MIRPLAVVLLLLPLTAVAHVRSESSSQWQATADGAQGTLRVPLREATRFQHADERPATLAAALAAALREDGIDATAGDSPCAIDVEAVVPDGRGGLVADVRVRCAATGDVSIRLPALFDTAAGHIHFASLGGPGGPRSGVVLTDAAEALRVTAPAAGVGPALWALFVTGVTHIASGADHVAFLIGLLLLCRGLARTAWAVTGFTVGHAASIVGVALGLVAPDRGLAEALIGFTVALVAALAVVRATSARACLAVALATAGGVAAIGLVRLAPGAAVTLAIALGLVAGAVARIESDASAPAWSAGVLAALFGVLHGIGFAGALASLGDAPAGLALRLVGFNLGIEVGQLAIVAMLLTGAHLLARTWPALPRGAVAAGVATLLAGLGAFWFAARLGVA